MVTKSQKLYDLKCIKEDLILRFKEKGMAVVYGLNKMPRGCEFPDIELLDYNRNLSLVMLRDLRENYCLPIPRADRRIEIAKKVVKAEHSLVELVRHYKGEGYNTNSFLYLLNCIPSDIISESREGVERKILPATRSALPNSSFKAEQVYSKEHYASTTKRAPIMRKFFREMRERAVTLQEITLTDIRDFGFEPIFKEVYNYDLRKALAEAYNGKCDHFPSSLKFKCDRH